MCNVPVQINGDVLAAYLSRYSSVEEVLPVWTTDRTAHSDYILNICLDREGFQAISHVIAYEDQQMMVVVKGEGLLCWSCKQVRHLARSCLQKAATSNNTTTIHTTLTNNNQEKASNTQKPGNHSNNPEEGWTQATRKKKSPSK